MAGRRSRSPPRSRASRPSEYAAMMRSGGRSPEGIRSIAGGYLMARITAGIGSSHVPAIGAALDRRRARRIPTGRPSSPVTNGRAPGCRSRSPTSSSSSTTTTPLRSRSTSCRRSRSGAPIRSRRPTRAGVRVDVPVVHGHLEARLAHCEQRRARRVRSDADEPDGRRPRAHRAAVTACSASRRSGR